MLSAQVEALVAQYKGFPDEPLPYLPPTVTSDDVPLAPPEDKIRILEAKAERRQLRQLFDSIIVNSYAQKAAVMEPLLELGMGLEQKNRGQSAKIEQLEMELRELRGKQAEYGDGLRDRSWDAMQLELAAGPPGASQRPDPVARSDAALLSAQETDLQAAYQTIREFQRARARILHFIYSALMFEPGTCTIDVFMADGKMNIVERTEERLMWCKLAQDKTNDVHKATREKLETVYAHAKRLEGQFATVKARSERQDQQISVYDDEVTRRDERITELDADHQKARQNVQKVFDTLDYVNANFNRVVQFGDSEAGDGAA